MNQQLEPHVAFKSTHKELEISFRTWTNEHDDKDYLSLEIETGCAYLMQSITIEDALILRKNIEDAIAAHTERQIQRRLKTS